jgi:RHS repeat-associated protein
MDRRLGGINCIGITRGSQHSLKWMSIAIVLFLMLAAYDVGASDIPSISLSVPGSIEYGKMLKIRVNISGGSEGIWFHTTGLSCYRGYFDHIGFTSNPCLVNDRIQPSCGWTPSEGHRLEFSDAYYGGLTVEYGVTACDEATIQGEYYGSQHSGPHKTGIYKIEIFGAVDAKLAPAPGEACVGETVSFDASSTCGAAGFTWDFGDGTTGSGKKVSHAYSTAGSYSVTVTAKYKGESDTASTSINIKGDCAKISGKVTIAADGSPLPGASVVARGAGSTNGESSKADGSYSIIVPGGESYSLEAHKSGFVSAYGSTGYLPRDETATWNVALAMEEEDDTDEEEVLGDQPNKVDDPVNPAIGNFFFSRTLFSFPGKNGLNFVFGVAYNSKDNTYDGSLGFGWTHNYDISLLKSGDDVTIRFGDGHREFYRFDSGSGAYVPAKSRSRVALGDRTGGGHVATLAGGVTYEFDGSGRLEKIADVNGNALTLTHTSQLDRITDTHGRQIDFTYSGGRITAVVSPYRAGNTLMFQYDGDGNLTAMGDPRGNAWQFTYDTAHRLVTETDRKGTLVLTNVYDAQDRVIEQTDALGGKTTYTYTTTAIGTEVDITPPSGNSVAHEYDAALNLVRVTDGEGRSASFGYKKGAGGQIAGATDKRSVPLDVSADQWGDITSITDRQGVKTDITYNTRRQPTLVTNDQGRSASFGYDSKGNLTLLKDSDRGIVHNQRNADGQFDWLRDIGGEQWEFIYDSKGLIKEITAGSTNKKTTFQRDSAGRVTQVDLPDSLGSARRAYDENGNVVSMKTPLGHETTFSYDWNDRLVSLTFVPTGAVTSYEYDVLGRLTKVTGPEGGVTTLAYDPDSNLVSTTDADGVTVQYRYDRRNQLTKVIDGGGAETKFDRNENGKMTGLEDGLGRSWTFEYDADGRPVKSVDPLGNADRVRRSVDGREIELIDPTGMETLILRDIDDRPVTVVKPDGSAFHRNYNLNGALAQLTDENGNIWKYKHSTLRRLESITDPDGKKSTFSYDALGQVKRSTRRNNSAINYEYDLDGRLTKKTLPDGTEIIYAHQYSDAGTLTSTMTDPNGTTTLTYDRLNRLIGKSDTFGKTLAFTYTPGGRIASMTYPGGKMVTYQYDSVGRLAKIGDWLDNQTTYQYDLLGRITRVSLPNGSKTAYGYDPRGLLENITHRRPDESIIVGYAFTRDSMGRIVTADQTGGIEPGFEDSDASYTYDKVNRIATSNKNGLPAVFQFDPDGNPVTRASPDDQIAYTYNALNLLTSILRGTDNTVYTYDIAGNRIGRVQNGIEDRFLQQEGTTYATFDGTGVATQYHIWGPGLVYTVSASGDVRVYHGDERGSVVAISDESGAAVKQYAYGPYGNLLASSGAPANEFRFLGLHGIMTDGNGLVHMNARYYDPEIGRFLNEDPLGTSAGTNMYAYVEGDPVNRIDPTGLQSGPTGLPPEIVEALEIFINKGVELNYRDVGYFIPIGHGDAGVARVGKVVIDETLANTYLNATRTTKEQIQLVQKDFDMHYGRLPVIKDVPQPPSPVQPPVVNDLPKPSGGFAQTARSLLSRGYRGLKDYGAAITSEVALQYAIYSTIGKMSVTQAFEILGGGTVGAVSATTAIVSYYASRYVSSHAGLVYDRATGDWITLDQAYQDLFRSLLVHDLKLKSLAYEDPVLWLREFLKEIGMDYSDYLKIRAEFSQERRAE